VFNTAMHACAASGDWRTALSLLEDMKHMESSLLRHHHLFLHHHHHLFLHHHHPFIIFLHHHLDFHLDIRHVNILKNHHRVNLHLLMQLQLMLLLQWVVQIKITEYQENKLKENFQIYLKLKKIKNIIDTEKIKDIDYKIYVS
jgi:pentatricopeptide repeat protein